jgi:hypothetical protein
MRAEEIFKDIAKEEIMKSLKEVFSVEDVFLEADASDTADKIIQAIKEKGYELRLGGKKSD